MLKKIKRKVLNILPAKLVDFYIAKRYGGMPLHWSRKKREQKLGELYRQKTGRELDFKNLQTFSEKIQWMKLYYNHPDLSDIVCKYRFKEYIREKIGDGYTVPLYAVYNSVDEIDLSDLPNQFVLKSNCCSDGRNIKIIKNKADVDIDKLKEELRRWLDPYNTLVNSYCKAYWDLKPMIIAEEYVEQLEGQVYDYKFFCFNGEPKFAYVATDHFEGQTSNISIYDLNWNRLDITYGVHTQNMVEAPKSLKEMIEISKKLSKDFPFVRVDFFELDEKPILSELTFYPGGGFNEINPPSVDKEWGDMIVLPCK